MGGFNNEVWQYTGGPTYLLRLQPHQHNISIPSISAAKITLPAQGIFFIIILQYHSIAKKIALKIPGSAGGSYTLNMILKCIVKTTTTTILWHTLESLMIQKLNKNYYNSEINSRFTGKLPGDWITYKSDFSFTKEAIMLSEFASSNNAHVYCWHRHHPNNPIMENK